MRTSADEAPLTASLERPGIPAGVSLILIALLAVLILGIIPRPEEVSSEGWRMLAIFGCTVLALMLRPVPGGAAVLIGVTCTVLAGVLPLSQALAGYGNPTVWLVVSAFFIARALINSGLARRIALLFVRSWGHTSLGLGYSLVVSDLILAAIIPSNSARVGGVVFPIARTLSVIYKSVPGATAGFLGAYLMLTVYQGDIVACAMYLTGQASNPIGADLALKTANVSMTWASWLWASIVPGIVSALVLPWFVFRVSPPEIRQTPEAAEMAGRELASMGPMTRREWIVLAVFAVVCGLWATSGFHGLETTTVALIGAGILVATRSLEWSDAVKEHVAWDVFVWYGGILRMGEALNEFGVTAVFARTVSGCFQGWEWPLLMASTLLIYFYVHYAFASLTAHFIALYAPFLAVLLAAGAPGPLAAYSMAFFTNLSASLTHYATTHSPIIFAAGYVPHTHWWKVGLLVSFVNLAIWSSIALLWWKLIGLW